MGARVVLYCVVGLIATWSLSFFVVLKHLRLVELSGHVWVASLLCAIAAGSLLTLYERAVSTPASWLGRCLAVSALLVAQLAGLFGLASSLVYLQTMYATPGRFVVALNAAATELFKLGASDVEIYVAVAAGISAVYARQWFRPPVSRSFATAFFCCATPPVLITRCALVFRASDVTGLVSLATTIAVNGVVVFVGSAVLLALLWTAENVVAAIVVPTDVRDGAEAWRCTARGNPG